MSDRTAAMVVAPGIGGLGAMIATGIVLWPHWPFWPWLFATVFWPVTWAYWIASILRASAGSS